MPAQNSNSRQQQSPPLWTAAHARRMRGRFVASVAPTPQARVSSTYQRIYAVVSRIPRGRVATYGQVASLAKMPRQARLVGYALHALPAGSRVPWHRVVNAAGKISLRAGAVPYDELQGKLLRREGVRFVGSAIPLEKYRWARGLV